MKNFRLIYNPHSGNRRRHIQMELAVDALRKAGIQAEILTTKSSEQATAEARRAAAEGCDTVFACGGDGTIHDVLQGLARTEVALGIVPLGTANALANDLGLPRNPAEAVRAALSAGARRIALGRVEYQVVDGGFASRYFTVAAGVGVDAHLFYKLQFGDKQRLGMAAYYLKAWHLWMTYGMPTFNVTYRDAGGSEYDRIPATELLAVRIRNFGGIVKELAPGADLERNDMRIVICRSASRMAYLAYVVRAMLGARWAVRGIDLSHANHVTCQPDPRTVDTKRIYVEADGELLGTLPATFSMVPDALTLLVPSTNWPR